MKTVLFFATVLSASAFANEPSVSCTSGGKNPGFVIEITKTSNSTNYQVKVSRREILGNKSRWIITTLTGALDQAGNTSSDSLQLFGENESGLQHIGILLGHPQIENMQTADLKFDDVHMPVKMPICKPIRF